MESPRKEVGRFANTGGLRDALEGRPNGLTQEAIELLVRIVINYCEPPRKRRKSK